MNESCGLCRRDNPGERGGTRLKFLLVMALILGVAYVGYQCIPVVYRYSLYKDMMQDNVDKAAMTGQSTAWIREQLMASAKDYGVPEDAEITPDKINSRMQVRVRFTRPIPLPGYTYQYNFDHTVQSTELFSPAK